MVGGVGNGAAEEDWHWDLNPGVAAIPERGPRGFGGEGGENHAALAEWGPRGSDTADGTRSLNLLTGLYQGNFNIGSDFPLSGSKTSRLTAAISHQW